MDEETYERWLDRKEERLRELGSRTPICSHPDCDEHDPFTLTGASPDIWCYEHQARAQGREWVEGQHVPGQHNARETLAMPGNDHRASDEMKLLWPEETLHNPNKSPLIRAAATLRGFLDFLFQLAFRIVAWIPGFLETLDGWLTDTIGESWWEQFKRDTGWEV